MTLIYRFKKEKLDNGQYVARPRILVTLSGKDASIIVPALIDSGCDVTVIPEGMAKSLGVDTSGKKERLYAYRESNDVVPSKAKVTFMGKKERQAITLDKVPVMVALSNGGSAEEEDIILGIAGVFDEFDINFKKSQNRILLKKVATVQTYG